MARAYRKKPVVVEAVQWTGENHAEMCEFIDPEAFEIIPRIGLVIHTLEGDHHASPGDYIIKGVNGEFYPCKPDIFAKTYESSTLTPPNEWVKVMEAINNAAVAYIEGGPYENDLPGMEFALKIDRLSRDFVRPPEGEEEEKHVVEITENL